jgi:CRP-like cAMP-binding protein
MTKIIRLEDAEVFGSLPAARLAEIENVLSERAVKASDYVYFDTQPAEHVWIVRSGIVRTLKGSASGRITTLEEIRPGGLFGMAAVRGDDTYGESAQGVVGAQLWRLPQRHFAELLASEPRVGQELLALIARRLQGAHDRLCSFAHDSVPARIARVVLRQQDGTRLDITRRALGESVGTTVETTIRVLRSFERAGFVESGVGWVRPIDRSALQAIAEGEKPPQ